MIRKSNKYFWVFLLGLLLLLLNYLILKRMRIVENCSLLKHNTFGIDVQADYMVEYSDVSELKKALQLSVRPILHIGAGSNLLFLDNFHGTIIRSTIDSVDVETETEDSISVRVGSGVLWENFVKMCAEKGWWGVENLSAIPGYMGAAAVQNIGAYGVELQDVVESVSAVYVEDNSERLFSRSECMYGYRNSVFKSELKGQYIITHVTLRLSKHPTPNLGYGELKRVVNGLGVVSLNNIGNAVRGIRAQKLPDPALLGNAGSFFMNPVVSVEHYKKLLKDYADMPAYALSNNRMKLSAGWMIESCGWKGRGLGKAAVHDMQALVLVNKGGATGLEIKELADRIIDDVHLKFNVTLSAEVNYI